jgi:hypothetical protein
MNRWTVFGLPIFLVISMATSLATTARADDPRPKQFVRGMQVIPQSTQPVVQLALPDEVYQTVKRRDLGDLRVFNSDDAVVPHALCAAPEFEPPVVTTVELPIVPIQVAKEQRHGGTQVEVQTTGGARIEVRERDGEAQPTADTQAHVIDVSGTEHELRSIELDWSTADGASEASVRIQASDDLDRWQTIVGATTLLRAGEQGQLRRERVTLPQARYKYLRVERADGGQPIQLRSAQAEQVEPARPIEPTWFVPERGEVKENRQRIRSERRAPVRYARLQLPYDNMTIRATLRSRSHVRSEWIERWSGEVYSLVADGTRKTSAPAEFGPVFDHEWQLEVTSATVADIGLELGYRPALLRFMAQGEPPFTLAYGSRQVETSVALDCNQLLSNVDAETRATMIGDAFTNPSKTLGGDDALRPLPRKTSLRLVVLWGVLIAGVATLVAMALNLMKRVQ